MKSFFEAFRSPWDVTKSYIKKNPNETDIELSPYVDEADFINFFITNTSVKHIKISGDIEDKFMDSLIAMLKKCSSVQSISFSGCNFSYSVNSSNSPIVKFAKALPEFKTLRRLDFGDTAIGSDAFTQIFAQLETDTKIEFLRITHCLNISEKPCKAFIKMLGVNQTIRHVDFDVNKGMFAVYNDKFITMLNGKNFLICTRFVKHQDLSDNREHLQHLDESFTYHLKSESQILKRSLLVMDYCQKLTLNHKALSAREKSELAEILPYVIYALEISITDKLHFSNIKEDVITDLRLNIPAVDARFTATEPDIRTLTSSDLLSLWSTNPHPQVTTPLAKEPIKEIAK